ncbi:MAG: FAD:protein FMN transferase, partial [Thermoleophilia bacterium]|nr:FAD:protein FMN transferase [Thermoleophilia bacterium]
TGASLDLGGIAKGYIADSVCKTLGATGASLVNAGGDIACSQRASDEMWSIEVDLAAPSHEPDGGTDRHHPNDEPLVLTLDAGGIATSGVTRRRWVDPGSGITQHHVIDPLTGTSVRTDAASVTVVADCCTTAEVWATALLVAGAHAAIAEAQAADLASVICCADGSVVFTGPLG